MNHHGTLRHIWTPGYLRDNILIEKANQTHQWVSAIEERNYWANIGKSKHVTYTDHEFGYSFNSLGFRSDEFENDETFKILYCGCSFTEGVGLPKEHTWPWLLNQQIQERFGIKMRYYNMGVGGFSSDAIQRHLTLLLECEKFKPDLVIILFPSYTRRELFFSESDDTTVDTYIPMFIPDHKTFEEKAFVKNYEKTINSRNNAYWLVQNMIACYHLCKANGIHVRMTTWETFDDLGVPEQDKFKAFTEILPDFVKGVFIPIQFTQVSLAYKKFPQTIARDFLHPSPNMGSFFAEQVFEHLHSFLEELIHEKVGIQSKP